MTTVAPISKPTEAQKEAGNYRKLHTSIHGMLIAIENALGTERSGTGKDGKKWSVTMPAHYGYVKGTEGKDGDHVDIYIGPHPGNPLIHVIDQVNPDTGAFDEHKAMLGFRSRKHAVETYHAGFSDGLGPKRVGAVTTVPVGKFKEWLAKGKRKRPMSARVRSFEEGGPTDDEAEAPEEAGPWSDFAEPEKGEEAGPWDDFEKTEYSAPAEAAKRVVKGVLPGLGSIPAIAAGAGYGASLGTPFGPIGAGAGAILGGAGAGIAASTSLRHLQDSILDKLGWNSDPAKAAAFEQEHPTLAAASDIAGGLAGMSPAKGAVTLAQRGVMAGAQGGIEAGAQLSQGQDLDPTNIAMAAAAGAAFPGLNKAGQPLWNAGAKFAPHGAATEGQPGRPDLKALPKPPDFTTSPEGETAPYAGGDDQSFNNAAPPRPGNPAENERPVYEMPRDQWENLGTSPPDNNAPPPTPQPPKTAESIAADKSDATPQRNTGGSVGTAHEQAPPNRNVEGVGSNPDHPLSVGSDRDYRTQATKTDAPTAQALDPKKGNMGADVELVLTGKAPPEAASPPPERIDYSSAGATRKRGGTLTEAANSHPADDFAAQQHEFTDEDFAPPEQAAPEGWDTPLTDAEYHAETPTIPEAAVTSTVAKLREKGLDQVADRLVKEPAAEPQVRRILQDLTAQDHEGAPVDAEKARTARRMLERAQSPEEKNTAQALMEEAKSPLVKDQRVAEAKEASETRANRRQAEGQVAKLGDQTVTASSERKANLIKRAADAAQSAFDKHATGKMGSADYGDLGTRLRAAVAHATEENLGVDPLKPMPKKRTPAQEWLKAARELVGTPDNPKTIKPAKAVKFMGDERMLKAGDSVKDVTAAERGEADTANNKRRILPEKGGDPMAKAWGEWMDTLSPKDRAEWQEENLKADDIGKNAPEDDFEHGFTPDDFEAEPEVGGRKPDADEQFNDLAKRFFGDEAGKLDLQKLIKSLRGNFGPRAQKVAQTYRARTPTSVRQEYAASLDQGLFTIKKLDEETRVQDLKKAKADPEPMKDPKVQEQVYLAREAGKLHTLPADIKAYYDKYLAPVFAENDDLFDKISKLGGNLGDKVKDHVYRIAKGLHPDYGGDPIAGVQGARGLSRTASMLKDRQFYAIEDAKGNRKIVSPTETGYAEWDNGKQTFRQNANFEPKVGETFSDHNSVQQTVSKALTPEIEQHALFSNGAKAEYYKHAALSAYETHAYLSDVLRHQQFLESLKADLDKRKWMTKNAAEGRANGWQKTVFPQMDEYYMPNQLRYVMDDFAKSGLHESALDWPRELSQKVTKLLFWNPVPHLGNVGVHWAVARGFDWLPGNGNYKRLAETGAQAIKSVMNQDHIQTEMRSIGSGTVYGGVITSNFLHELGHAYGMTIKSNPHKWDPIARTLGMSTPDLARAVYRASSKIMWAGNDMMLTQKYLENKAKGMTPQQARTDAERDIPNYRIPATVITSGAGGRFMAKALGDPLISAFGRYHFGVFNSYANIIKDAAQGSPEQRKEAIGKMMVMAAIAYGVYPLLDSMAKVVTGNKDASMQRRGPISIPHHLGRALQGIEDPMQAARGTFTIAPMAATAMETLANRDWAGRPIMMPGDVSQATKAPTMGGKVRAAGRAAVQQGEHLARGLVSPYGTLAQAMDAKRNPFGTVRDQLMDIRNPSQAAANYERTAPQKNLAASINRQNGKGGGPAERLYNRLTR